MKITTKTIYWGCLLVLILMGSSDLYASPLKDLAAPNPAIRKFGATRQLYKCSQEISFERNIMGSINSMREGNWLGRMTGHYYPTKLNRGGLYQPRGFNGRYLPYEANPGFMHSGTSQFTSGYAKGFGEGYYGVAAPPAYTVTQGWGQIIGRITGEILGVFK